MSSGDGDGGAGGGHEASVRRNEALEVAVGVIWMHIVRHIKDVLKGSELGYEHIGEWADPSIEEIVKSVTKIDGLLNDIFDGAAGTLSHSCESLLINCQQSVHLIRRVHISVKHDNQDEYNDVIEKLTQQSKVIVF